MVKLARSKRVSGSVVTWLIVLSWLSACALIVAGRQLLSETYNLRAPQFLAAVAVEPPMPQPLSQAKRAADGKLIPASFGEMRDKESEWAYYAGMQKVRVWALQNKIAEEMRCSSTATWLYYAACALLIANCIFVVAVARRQGLLNRKPAEAPATKILTEGEGA